jgi:hypothetical protein
VSGNENRIRWSRGVAGRDATVRNSGNQNTIARVAVAAPPVVVVQPAPPPPAQPAPVEVVVAPPPEIIVQVAPPTVRVERRTPRPPGRVAWIRGYWHWDGAQHVWVDGKWEPARTDARWVAPRWIRRRGTWIYRPGHWRSRR